MADVHQELQEAISKAQTDKIEVDSQAGVAYFNRILQKAKQSEGQVPIGTVMRAMNEVLRSTQDLASYQPLLEGVSTISEGLI